MNLADYARCTSTGRYSIGDGWSLQQRLPLSPQRSRLANSFPGGGLWQPEAAALAKLRRDIDRKPHKIKLALTNAGIRKAFLKNVANDQDKAVHAFATLAVNKSTALKRHPKASLNNLLEAKKHVMAQFHNL
jgi:hypothetical protein